MRGTALRFIQFLPSAALTAINRGMGNDRRIFRSAASAVFTVLFGKEPPDSVTTRENL